MSFQPISSRKIQEPLQVRMLPKVSRIGNRAEVGSGKRSQQATRLGGGTWVDSRNHQVEGVKKYLACPCSVSTHAPGYLGWVFLGGFKKLFSLHDYLIISRGIVCGSIDSCNSKNYLFFPETRTGRADGQREDCLARPPLRLPRNLSKRLTNRQLQAQNHSLGGSEVRPELMGMPIFRAKPGKITRWRHLMGFKP